MTKRTKHEIAVKWCYNRVRTYCEMRTSGIGGYFKQASYKMDFFRIFRDAFYLRMCGKAALKRHSKWSIVLSRKTLVFADYVITGSTIETMLRETWLLGVNNTVDNTGMVKQLADWWSDWEYAWEHFPEDLIRPRRTLRKLREKIDEWHVNAVT